MKILKIDDGKGYFLKENSFCEIDQITKDDILHYVDLIIGGEELEYDEYDENKLHNEAHKIIYGNLLDKIIDLKNHKDQLTDSIDQMYKTEIEKYSEQI
jgi:hypothetical protein